jgi:hypothetical protein
MRKDHKWTVCGANNIDVVSGVDVHGYSLIRQRLQLHGTPPRRTKPDLRQYFPKSTTLNA